MRSVKRLYGREPCAWTEEEIAAFETVHPIGSMERLAFSLALYTALRSSDLLSLGQRDVRNTAFHITLHKTREKLVIPIHPALAQVIAATPNEHPTYLTTKSGQPFSPQYFSRWFAKACRTAGLLKGAFLQGLRRAAIRRLAQSGCSVAELAAITGLTHGLLSMHGPFGWAGRAHQELLARRSIQTMEHTFPAEKTPEAE
jgi:integrase